MRLDRGLRPGLVRGAESEPLRQHRLLHVVQIPHIELSPRAGVTERVRIGLIAVRGPSLQGELVSGLRDHRALKSDRGAVVPVDHLVDQLAVVGMNLICQIGAGDVLHRAVVAPYPVRQRDPAPADQIVAGEPQPPPPARADGGVALTPDPGQLAIRRVAVDQVEPRGRDPLRQALHEPHVRSGHKIGIAHGAPLCQGRAKPSNHFPLPPTAPTHSRRLLPAAEYRSGRCRHPYPHCCG